jgi:hypothetical protein
MWVSSLICITWGSKSSGKLYASSTWQLGLRSCHPRTKLSFLVICYQALEAASRALNSREERLTSSYSSALQQLEALESKMEARMNAAKGAVDELLGRMVGEVEERAGELLGQQEKLVAEVSAWRSSMEMTMAQERWGKGL